MSDELFLVDLDIDYLLRFEYHEYTDSQIANKITIIRDVYEYLCDIEYEVYLIHNSDFFMIDKLIIKSEDHVIVPYYETNTTRCMKRLLKDQEMFIKLIFKTKKDLVNFKIRF